MIVQEVDSLLEDLHHLPSIFSGNNLAAVLTEGSNWLRNAILMSPESQRSKRCKLEDVEEVLEQSEVCPFMPLWS